MTIEPTAGGRRQPQPFAPPPETATEGDGCRRSLLLGCAAAVVLAGVLLLVLLVKAGEWMPALFAWSLDQFEQQVTGNLPDDVDAAERRRLAAAFDAAAEAVADGTADPEALRRLQTILFEVARAGGELTRDQVLELAAALEAVAGGRKAPAPAPELAAMAAV